MTINNTAMTKPSCHGCILINFHLNINLLKTYSSCGMALSICDMYILSVISYLSNNVTMGYKVIHSK